MKARIVSGELPSALPDSPAVPANLDVLGVIQRFGHRWLEARETRRWADSGGAVNRIIGIILIVLGLVGLAWGGFHYKTRQRVLDVGPIHATRTKTHSVPLPPLAGALALIGGIVLLVIPAKN